MTLLPRRITLRSDSKGDVELFVSPRQGPADSVRISGPIVAFGGGVIGFQVR